LYVEGLAWTDARCTVVVPDGVSDLTKSTTERNSANVRLAELLVLPTRIFCRRGSVTIACINDELRETEVFAYNSLERILAPVRRNDSEEELI